TIEKSANSTKNLAPPLLWTRDMAAKFKSMGTSNNSFVHRQSSSLDPQPHGQSTNEVQSLLRKLIAGGGKVTPDGSRRSEAGLRLCERFDGQPAVVMDN